MKVLRFIMMLIVLGGFSYCHKKEYPKPEVVENTAVFYSKLTIDNQPVVLQAGVDGYYMYSSYKLDSNFVYGFIADLKKSECSNCTNSLKIQINDYKVSLSNPVSFIDSSLRKAQYPFLSGNAAASYSIQFFGLNDNTVSYEWDFGDGSPKSFQANPIKTFSKSGIYNVCLTTTTNKGCVNSICNRQKIDQASVKTQISVNLLAGNSISFNSATIDGKGPYQYLWNFGDGGTCRRADTIYTYKYGGGKSVSLRVVDAYGDTAYANYNAKTLSDLSSCTANYSVGKVAKMPANPALSQIIINWVDANGDVYTSNSALQPTTSTFEILSVSENDKNENQQATKKVTARFNCKLFHGTKSITVSDAEVVICVAYK